MSEQAVVFACKGEPLVGVISVPAGPPDTAVLVIVGGPQYRVGSHRQYVQLSRHLAQQGIAAMRFDVRGMGDSPGVQRTFEEINDDIAAALDALQAAQPTVRRIALWGLCGGASAALLYWRATRDSRVQGMILVNPWVRSDVILARTRMKHYYVKRLMQRDFYFKLLSGRIAGRALTDLANSLRLSLRSVPAQGPVVDERAATLQERMADSLVRFTGRTLLVLSGNDYTAKEFVETVRSNSRWRAILKLPSVTRLDVEGADHTFSDAPAQRKLEEGTSKWLNQWTQEE